MDTIKFPADVKIFLINALKLSADNFGQNLFGYFT